MLKSLSISGSSRDFSIIRVPSADGLMVPWLVPNGDGDMGRMMSLLGVERIEFSDRSIDLAATVWASSQMSDRFAQSGGPQVRAGHDAHAQDPDDAGMQTDTSGVGGGASTRLKNSQPLTASEPTENFSGGENRLPDNVPPAHEFSDGLFGTGYAEIADAISMLVQSPPTSSGHGERSAEVGGGRASGESHSSSSSSGSGGNYSKPAAAETVVADFTPRTLWGTAGNDVLRGGDGADVFYTSAGINTYVGGGGVDTLVGVATGVSTMRQVSQGIYRYDGAVSNISQAADGTAVDGGVLSGSPQFIVGIELFKASDDQEAAIKLSQLAIASEFSDELTPLDGASPWRVDAGKGNDVLVGGNSGDDLHGGEGNDRIDGGTNDLLTADRFSENLSGGAGNDVILFSGFKIAEGTEPALTVNGQISGGSGNDRMTVMLDGLTNLQLSGGEGVDTLALQSTSQGKAVFDADYMSWGFVLRNGAYLLEGHYLSPSHPEAGLFETDASIEKVALGSGESLRGITLVRPDAANPYHLPGSDGDDLLLPVAGGSLVMEAGGGNDIVVAAAGASVSLGSGINQLHGSGEDVTLSYAWASNSVQVNLASRLGMVFDGSDLIAFDRLHATPETVTGSSHGDTLVGDAAANTLRGEAGDDRLFSGGGDDQVFGVEGDDTITLNGPGHVIASGGEGADQFVLDVDFSGRFSVELLDFSHLQGDGLTINLNAYSDAISQSFGGYQILDQYMNTLVTGGVGRADESVIRFMLDTDQDSFGWIGLEGNNAFLHFSQLPQDMTPEQLATLITIDYL